MEIRLTFWYMGEDDITQEQALDWAMEKLLQRANLEGLELIERFVLDQHGNRWGEGLLMDGSSLVTCVFAFKADEDMMP